MSCTELSDRMPAVARGEAEWSAKEMAHLQACADCRAEWAVVSAGVGVGSGAALDADALAARVLQRLKTEPVARRSRARFWLAGLAAAAAVILVVSTPWNRSVPGTVATAPALEAPVPGLNTLNASELDDVLQMIDTPWTETSTADSPSLDDLDLQGLEQVQQSMET
jgi:hypothetical protein